MVASGDFLVDYVGGGWLFRNSILIPEADPIPIPKLIFMVHCYFEGFRLFMVSKSPKPEQYAVWTEQEIHRKQEELGFNEEQVDVETSVKRLIAHCGKFYPMVLRENLVTRLHSLLKQFEENHRDYQEQRSDMIEDPEEEGE